MARRVPLAQPSAVAGNLCRRYSSSAASVHGRGGGRRAAGAKDEGIVRRGAGGGDPRAIGWVLRANCRARKGQPLTRANCRGRAPPPTSANRARVGGARADADRGRGQGARAGCPPFETRCCFAGGDVLNVYQRKSRTTVRWLCPCPVLV